MCVYMRILESLQNFTILAYVRAKLPSLCTTDGLQVSPSHGASGPVSSGLKQPVH